LLAGIIIGLAVYLDLHVNPAYTTLNILSGKASSSEIVTRIIPQIAAAILAALTVSLLS
jgi:glycerol uptake facilitator-like aquaporin